VEIEDVICGGFDVHADASRRKWRNGHSAGAQGKFND